MADRKSDVTILVNSCDLYEDAWDPFFILLSIQWPECKEYPIVLNSETKKYHCKCLDVKTISSGKKPWSSRLKNCLDRIESTYVLFFLEDQFLRSPVNTQWWNHTLDYMKQNQDIGVIFLHHTGNQVIDYPDDYFPRIFVNDRFPIVGLAALYRRDYLKKLLRKHESPWEYEQYGSIRSKRYKEKVLQYNKKNPPIFVYDDRVEIGYGITQRKWLPKNKDLFEQYGIDVNFDNLGIMDAVAYQALVDSRTRANAGKEVMVEKSESKNSVRDSLHLVKKSIKSLPKRIKKKIRIIRSLT